MFSKTNIVLKTRQIGSFSQRMENEKENQDFKLKLKVRNDLRNMLEVEC